MHEDIKDVVEALTRLVYGKSISTNKPVNPPKTRTTAANLADVVTETIYDPLTSYAEKLSDLVRELVWTLDDVKPACAALRDAVGADAREDAYQELDELANDVIERLKDLGVDVTGEPAE